MNFAFIDLHRTGYNCDPDETHFSVRSQEDDIDTYMYVSYLTIIPSVMYRDIVLVPTLTATF